MAPRPRALRERRRRPDSSGPEPLGAPSGPLVGAGSAVWASACPEGQVGALADDWRGGRERSRGRGAVGGARKGDGYGVGGTENKT